MMVELDSCVPRVVNRIPQVPGLEAQLVQRIRVGRFRRIRSAGALGWDGLAKSAKKPVIRSRRAPAVNTIVRGSP